MENFQPHKQCGYGVIMRLTSKGRYAVTAMLDVALHSQQTQYRWRTFLSAKAFLSRT